jgi:uncharacterized protein (DUF433 family)
METVVHSINLIVSNPEVRGGRPCLAGTGVRVADVVMAQVFHRQTPDEIAVGYGVSLAAVHAALAYYYEHQAEVDEDIRQQIARARELKAAALGNEPRSLLPR